MAKRLVISEFWERTKLGKLATHPSNAESHLHLVKRAEKFNKLNEFIKWVDVNGDHSKGYLLRIVKIDIDEKYDPNSGMVCITISQPEYSARIHRKGEGWGNNNYGKYNYLPDFDWHEYVPIGYPIRIVKFNGKIVEEIDRIVIQ